VIDEAVLSVVQYAYEMGGFYTRSNFARGNAENVAAAALQGLLTTEVPREGYGSIWRPTPLGTDAIFVGSGTPSSLYTHGGLPDGFLSSLTERPQLAH